MRADKVGTATLVHVDYLNDIPDIRIIQISGKGGATWKIKNFWPYSMTLIPTWNVSMLSSWPWNYLQKTIWFPQFRLPDIKIQANGEKL